MKDNTIKKDYSKKIFTIPNILSFIRLGAVPVFIFVFFYFYDSIPYLAGIIFALIALTDVVDGFIARHFNMISDAGKVLDPLADKVSQIACIICLMIKGNVHHGIFVILCAKELYMIICGTILYNRHFVMSAKWVGKINSLCINIGAFLALFINVNGAVGKILNAISFGLLVVGVFLSVASAIYYTAIVWKQTGGHLPPKKSKVEQVKETESVEINLEVSNSEEITLDNEELVKQ